MPGPAFAHDRTHCPLCGKANQCSLAAGAPVTTCWCHRAPVDPAVLAALPPPVQGQVCLCARCAAGPRGEGTAIAG